MYHGEYPHFCGCGENKMCKECNSFNTITNLNFALNEGGGGVILMYYFLYKASIISNSNIMFTLIFTLMQYN